MANVELEPSTIDEEVRRWVEEIDLSRKREENWRKDGVETEELYEGKQEVSFNILYSNTETLMPSLYGAMPRPVVQRRFKDDDPLGKATSTASQRLLEFLLDTNSDQYETFDESIKDAVHDALLPGRGLTEFCYHADVEDYEGGSKLTHECVYPKSFVWNRFYHGYAKKWSDVPWCAVELYLDREAVKKEFGDTIADKMQYSHEGSENRDKKEDAKPAEEKSKTKTACIYKIWDKKKREIVWVSPNHPTSLLRTDEDELKLTGFYPFPKPLRFLRKSNNLMPTAIYKLYKTQASELNTISKRLVHLISACKVRGVYDSTIGEIEEVLKAEENTLLPADQVAALQTTKGLEGAIWLLPIEKIITVIKELYLAREQCKRIIYEITGISDIVRGQTTATETLGAQKIKEQWVTLRLKNMQKEVQRYVRDSLRIMLEIAAQRFQPETWGAMTGLPFTTPEDYEQVKQVAMELKQRMASMPPPQAQPPQPGQPPAPPPQPPQMPPEIQQKLQAPQWSQIIEVLQDDLQRQYKIDIESNSTLDVEANEDKELVAELMNAIAQFLNGIGPLIQDGIMPFQAAQAMLLAIIRKFRFGDEIEDYIKAMQEPKPKDDGKAAAEQQKAQSEKERLEFDKQEAMAKLKDAQEGRNAKLQGEQAQRQHDAQIKSMELEAEEQADLRRIAAEREAHLAELAATRETERMKAKLQQETELLKAEIAANSKSDSDDVKMSGEVLRARAADADRAATERIEHNKVKSKEAADKTDAESKTSAAMTEAMKQIAATQKSIVELLEDDKEVVRDSGGKIQGVRRKKKDKK